MTAIEWLEGVRKHECQVRHLIDERDRLRDIAEKITAGTSDGGSFSSGPSDKVGNSVVKLVDLAQEINDRIVECAAYRHDVCTKLHDWLTPIEYEIMYLRYVSFKTWADVACDLGYCERQVQRLKLSALEKIEANLKYVT